MLINSFWKKWTRGFFHSLIICQKWDAAHRNLEINDIALIQIQDTNIVQGNRKMGKISKMLPSTDEKVRNVELIYKNIDQGKRASTYT